MNLVINNSIYQQAQMYAQEQGISLNTVVENFLKRFVSNRKKLETENVPDVVLSLLGAAAPVEESDINGQLIFAVSYLCRNPTAAWSGEDPEECNSPSRPPGKGALRGVYTAILWILPGPGCPQRRCKKSTFS